MGHWTILAVIVGVIYVTRANTIPDEPDLASESTVRAKVSCCGHLLLEIQKSRRSVDQNGTVPLGEEEIEDAREVFDLFDFWDGRDGEVDAFKLGDLLRCLGLNPLQATVTKHGGKTKMGEKSYKFDEFLPLYKELINEKDTGTFADFMEAFKTFDREGQGFISGAELRHLLSSLGEKLTDMEVDDILKHIDLNEDLEGNVKYEECIKKILQGPN